VSTALNLSSRTGRSACGDALDRDIEDRRTCFDGLTLVDSQQLGHSSPRQCLLHWPSMERDSNVGLILNIDERVIKQGAANMQRGIETVGGQLYLTNQRLLFSAHRFNVQTGDSEVPLRTISSVQRCWTRFLGVLPLLPNSLAVHTRDEVHRFVVFGRSHWADAIHRARDLTSS